MYNKAALGLVAAASFTAPVYAASGSGVTTRYWDCCKPSCAWSGKASVSAPAETCDKSDNPLTDVNAQSGCDGGTSFACSNYSPWAVDDNLAYGFAATNIAGGTESSWCCACYQLDFTSGPVAGKSMIVQSTNTGGDLGSNQFDLMMPGGGVGLFDGCSVEFGQPLPGQQDGGVSSDADCDDANMPEILRAGCHWRFGWFMNADNPNVNFKQVACPTEILAVSNCKRTDDGSFPAALQASSPQIQSSSTAAAATAASPAATSSSSVILAAEPSTVVAEFSSTSAATSATTSVATSAAATSSAAAESSVAAAQSSVILAAEPSAVVAEFTPSSEAKSSAAAKPHGQSCHAQ
ncbi:RlpA-like double-psi beta-barrel-protein domain-containing protein-containing protein [Xylaria sp. CBS 124048]|nr:RlpA-like double-psi beta-barrel-protein domain-containing protein-containing protein [Xylaria sp. CBS 124048]